jgi:hypothetical protein
MSVTIAELCQSSCDRRRTSRADPARSIRLVLAPFAPLFSHRVWLHAHVLLLGAILAPGMRTVTTAAAGDKGRSVPVIVCASPTASGPPVRSTTDLSHAVHSSDNDGLPHAGYQGQTSLHQAHSGELDALHQRFRDEITGSHRRAAVIAAHRGTAIGAYGGVVRGVSSNRAEADREGRVMDSRHPGIPVCRLSHAMRLCRTQRLPFGVPCFPPRVEPCPQAHHPSS